MADDGTTDDQLAPSFRYKWDVFLSFRGEDTRHGFTTRLYEELVRNGVRPFLDDVGLGKGDEIDPGLLEAIQDSAAAIAIISPNYASSRWCLEELARIIDCRRLLLPVFYQVNPSDVRRQEGPFKEHFQNLEVRLGKDKVGRWRKAMESAGGRSGWDSACMEEQRLIQLLVQRVLTKLSNTPFGVAKYPVGLNSRLEELTRILDVSATNAHVLGLHGMGGVGKTTLAKAVYNKLVIHFKHRSFISNVKETWKQDDGKTFLQQKLISDLSSDSVPSVASVSDGIKKVKKLLRNESVIIVFDDVDAAEQLDDLLGQRDLLRQRSIIIITTRDKEILVGKVDYFYEVRELDSEKSLQLFSYHAFGRDKPAKDFVFLSRQMVNLAGGLPLALEVFGSLLSDKRRMKDWESALQKLKMIRPGDLQDVLQISVDELEVDQKCVFLDIACFFVQMNLKREDAVDIVTGCGLSAEIIITVLAARSLVKIIDEDILWMHDQIRDMGRQIVRSENLEDPGWRSRLWDCDEILRTLKNEKGTGKIRGIVLDFQRKKLANQLSRKRIAWDEFWTTFKVSSGIMYLMEAWRNFFYPGVQKVEVKLCTKSFEGMINLKLLQINYVRMEGRFEHMPAGIKWLQWKGCPSKTLPPDFCPQELAVLDLSQSKIEQLWRWRWWNWWNWHCKPVARELMMMNLHGCCNLIALPDLSGHTKLEKLTLERCSKLTKIHASVGDLSSLIHLNLRDCSNLVEFPSDVSGLKKLERLILSGCTKLKELPEDLRGLKSLREFLIDRTAIMKLPESIGRLTKLERLYLDHCRSLTQLPMSIGMLTALRELSLYSSAVQELPASMGSLANLESLNLMHCVSLMSIPQSVGDLKLLTEIKLYGSSIEELPASIGLLSYLKNLSVGNCSRLTQLPASIDGLASLIELDLDGTSVTYLPDQISGLKMLNKFTARNCKSLKCLPDTIGGLVSLHTLVMVGAAVTELPESIGMLQDLTFLNLNKCKQLCRLPDSIGKLSSLHHLLMEETAVEKLPESFGMLSCLMILRMAKKPQYNGQEEPGMAVLPPSFTNLRSLKELNARAWKISGKIPDDFEKLSSLVFLNLGHNDFSSLPTNLRGLCVLKNLLLPHCKKLRSLPPLPSSLQELNLAHCMALESIADLSNLIDLLDLHLTNCAKLLDVPGFEYLKSLRMLNMSGCSGCSSAVKSKLSKDVLKKLFCLSIPGSEIPGWFSKGVFHFSKHRNHEVECIIISLVVSLNEKVSDERIYELPIIADFEAVICRLNKKICNTTLYLMGVPKVLEAQLYLCRFMDHQPLVFNLLDGDTIQVVQRDPGIIEGLELKECGIHVVYENDDDYVQDEDLLADSQQSVSQKLERFLHSPGGRHVSQTNQDPDLLDQ